ncbi:protein TRI1-like [Magnolia sinica]|uniref:protein TRI1-like n=1 Tax=Magnolia sinica TaxID=86752 RepID=UPI002659BCC1|nr:protein TRI1-like [Magnolia sinica]
MLRVLRGSRVLMAAAVRGGGKASVQSPNPTVVGAASSRTASTSGILKPVPVSPAMSKFLGGIPEISRTQAIKKVWEHIKLNQLQNPANKKEICYDEKLKAIFGGRDKVGFLEIAKLLSPHFVKAK